MAISSKVKEILEAFGIQLVEDLKESILSKKHGSQTNNSSDQSSLAGSIKYKIFGRDTAVTFSLTMADYWEAVDKGRGKGKKPPPVKSGELDRWQDGKGINALQIYRSKLKNPDKSTVTFQKARRGLSFAIAKAIAKNGTILRFGYRGSLFYTSVIKDGRIDKLKKDLAKALKRDVEIELFETIRKK